MGQSLWSQFVDWAEDTAEDVKEWTFGLLYGDDSDDADDTLAETDESRLITTHTIESMPSTASDIIMGSPISPPILTTSSIEPIPSFTTSALPTTTSPTFPVETKPAPSEGEPESGSFHGAFMLMLILFIISQALLLYFLLPIFRRFIRFLYDVTRVSFGADNNSFARDSELGLSSESFSLTRNIDEGDARKGLDKSSKIRILWYMFIHGETFDDARLRLVRYQFSRNGIGADGQPLDPKFLSRQ